MKRIEVQLREDSGYIHLTIRELGRGFEVEAAQHGKGLGVTSRERVKLVNGTIVIDSKPMGGRTIHMRVPLDSEHGSRMASSGGLSQSAQDIRQFRSEARFSTWLIQIAVNEALMRRRRERTNLVEPIEKDGYGEGNYTPRDFAGWREIPSEALERKEIREKLGMSRCHLSQRSREAWRNSAE